MWSATRIGAVLIALSGLVGPGAWADVFVLQGGGQVRGELVNRNELPRKAYVIKTSTGGQITLDAEQVKEVKRQSPAELEYEQIRGTFPDTVDDQWNLAEWCHRNRLAKQRKTHLERVIELDPNHAQARHGLGYMQLQGRWVTQESLMTENGYVRYKNTWVLPQEVEIKEQERKEKLAQLEWNSKLKRWHAWLTTDKADQAQANIKAIDDPFAAHALGRFLSNSKQDPRSIRMLYVDALGRLGDHSGMDSLILASLFDFDEEIRLASLDQVVAHQYKPAITKYVKELKSKENAVVNRAALGLARMKDPAAIAPLIDALVTTHTIVVPDGQPGQMTTTFGTGPNSGGSFSFGGGGPKVFKQQIENREVLNALVTISGGVNFDYDRSAWKYWYAAKKKPQTLDARRDGQSK